MSQESKHQDVPPSDGYAFPLMPTQELWDRGLSVSTGMTLREYYAGQALSALRVGDWCNCEDAARWCFDMADAMMTEKLKAKVSSDESIAVF